MNFLAQILGCFGLIFLIISIQNNNKKKILLFQIFANIFYGLQYITLNSFSAGLMSLVSLIRCVIFYKYSEKSKTTPKYILFILLLIICIISIFTYNGVISLIPILATILYTYATWQDNLKKFRIITTFVALLWIIFNSFVGAYIALISSVFELFNGLVSIYRFDIKKEKNK
ncbi:MAG: YgjV family protein [Firmicutes bacterium]|nr:YgjV family protein [Bacillota bacterium]